MPEIVVTLDIGGSGVKASCFDPAGDVAPTATVVRYPSSGHRDDGTFDPDVWAETATAALAQVVERCPAMPHHYLGITVSAIRIPFVLLDADQRAVRPSLLNRDRRALPIVNDLVAQKSSPLEEVQEEAQRPRHGAADQPPDRADAGSWMPRAGASS